MDSTQQERSAQDTTLPVRHRGQADASQASTPAEAPPRQPYTPYLPYSSETRAMSGEGVGPEGGPDDLPTPRPGADLAERQPKARWTLLVFAVTLVVYLAFVPRFLRYSNPPTGDQPFYLMNVISLLEDGDLNVHNNYVQVDERQFYPPPPEERSPDFVGIAAPFPLPPQIAVAPARPENEWYSSHMPGLSFVILPGWVIGSWFGQGWPGTIVVMCILGALLAANVFLAAHQLTGRMGISLAVWAGIAFANPVWSYSYLIFTELPTGLLLIYAFRRLAMGWGANETWRLALIGAAIGFIPWLAWRCVPLAAVLGLYAVVQWLRYRRQGAEDAHARSSGSLLPTAAFLVPIAVFGALLSAYALFLTGDIIPSTTQQERGVEERFNWPWQGIEAATFFVRAVFGLLLDRRFGLLVYSPIYLLAIAGVAAMFRGGRAEDRRLVLWIAALVVPYYFVVSAYGRWHGVWSPPARYLVTLVPLAAFPLAMSFRAFGEGAARWARWLFRSVYVLFVAVGLALMGVMLADARTMWPLNEVFVWIARAPESPLKVDLVDYLPYFIPVTGDPNLLVGDFNLPRTTALWLGASVLLVLLFVWAMNRAGAARRSLVPGWRAGPYAAVTVGVLALVGAGWYTMNAEFFRPATVVTRVQTWTVPVELRTPRGITLREGKMYIADYEGPTVGELDLATGGYRLIEARGPEGPAPYVHPGDVQFGPDGLLYVLNNGTGTEALYAMTLDGQVQKRIALEGKADISVGLRFRPDGGIVIADMRRAVVLGYGPDGGPPIMESAGEGQKGIENITGLELDSGGNIYAFEMSGFRVQVLAPDGRFVRDYKLKCQPMFGAMRDGWLEVTCEQGIVSVNLETGHVQPSRILGWSSSMPKMLGVTYGPDGTLYVIHDGALHAYRVEH
ncbi:MAG TPA: hypothetical protein VFR15_07030 [Chloroflexia bacterium]|nr:hypothetical protein [Chloroflexia bacterium]